MKTAMMIVVGVFICCTSEAANLEYVGTNLMKHDLYVDIDTIVKTSAGTVKVWVHGVCTEGTEGKPDCYEQGALEQAELQCSERLYRERVHKGPNGGYSSHSHEKGDSAEWKDVQPGTITEGIMDIVCKAAGHQEKKKGSKE